MDADELPHTLSHDLRGPLMAISGAAELICAIAAPTEPELRDWCNQIHHATSVMERLIHDLLEVGSFEDAQLRLHPAAHDANAIVRGAVEAVHKAASAKNISLAADLPAAAVVVDCDRNRIAQVVSNILRNAVAFTPDGGSIRVRVRRRGNEVHVAIADSGIGIPRSAQAAVFERFRQHGDGERTGPGLGLYIAKWIVDAHRGRIWVRSRVGRGSTFYFALPLSSPSPRTGAAERRARQTRAVMTHDSTR